MDHRKGLAISQFRHQLFKQCVTAHVAGVGNNVIGIAAQIIGKSLQRRCDHIGQHKIIGCPHQPRASTPHAASSAGYQDFAPGNDHWFRSLLG